MNEEKKGTLYVVATPIGNLQDITLRSLEVLKSVDLIACEDTRVTGKLLAHFDIKKPLVSYFQHSKLSKVELLIEKLLMGENIAFVTDAGTPAISDPGVALIAEIRKGNVISTPFGELRVNSVEKSSDNNKKISRLPSVARDDNFIKIIPIPGASALAAAASISGLIEKEFYFAGFLPKKKRRQTFFKNASLFHCPIVIYESALRLEKTLNDIQKYLGNDTKVFIAREMTKMFEEYWGGGIMEVIDGLKSHQMKGEIVLIVKKN